MIKMNCYCKNYCFQTIRKYSGRVNKFVSRHDNLCVFMHPYASAPTPPPLENKRFFPKLIMYVIFVNNVNKMKKYRNIYICSIVLFFLSGACCV